MSDWKIIGEVEQEQAPEWKIIGEVDEVPVSEQLEQEPVGMAHSALIGARNAGDTLMHGITQPLLESGLLGQKIKNASKQIASERAMRYEHSFKQNPVSTSLGNISGNIGMMLPTMLIPGGAATKAPAVMKYLHAAKTGAIAGAGAGATQYVKPEESRLYNTLQGGLLGGASGVALPPLAKAAGTVLSPVWGATKAVGRGLNSVKEATLREFGNKSAVKRQLLSGLLPEEIEQTLANKSAAQKLGISLTPAEASGNPILASAEGKLGTSKQGQQDLYRFKRNRALDEENVVKDVLNEISPSDANASNSIRDLAKSIIKSKKDVRQSKASPFYKASENVEIQPKLYDALMKDSNINRANNLIRKSEVFKTELEGVSPYSIKNMDLISKQLNTEIAAAKAGKDQNVTRILTQASRKLKGILDQASPDYKKARAIFEEGSPFVTQLENSPIGKISLMKDKDLKNISKTIFDPQQTDKNVLIGVRNNFMKADPDAWNRIVRQEMERKLANKTMGKTNHHGSNFFNNILADPKTYNQFRTAVKNNPDSYEKLGLMKDVFRDLTNNYTVKTASGQSKSHVDVTRNIWQQGMTYARNLLGGKYDKAAIDLITKNDWDRDLLPIISEKSGMGRNLDILNLLNGVIGGHTPPIMNFTDEQENE